MSRLEYESMLPSIEAAPGREAQSAIDGQPQGGLNCLVDLELISSSDIVQCQEVFARQLGRNPEVRARPDCCESMLPATSDFRVGEEKCTHDQVIPRSLERFKSFPPSPALGGVASPPQ